MSLSCIFNLYSMHVRIDIEKASEAGLSWWNVADCINPKRHLKIQTTSTIEYLESGEVFTEKLVTESIKLISEQRVIHSKNERNIQKLEQECTQTEKEIENFNKDLLLLQQKKTILQQNPEIEHEYNNVLSIREKIENLKSRKDKYEQLIASYKTLSEKSTQYECMLTNECLESIKKEIEKVKEMCRVFFNSRLDHKGALVQYEKYNEGIKKSYEELKNEIEEAYKNLSRKNNQ